MRQITVGPTAVMAIMTHEYTLKGGAPYAIVLSFLAGCLELMAGLLNLGTIQLFFLSLAIVIVLYGLYCYLIQVGSWTLYQDRSSQGFARLPLLLLFSHNSKHF